MATLSTSARAGIVVAGLVLGAGLVAACDSSGPPASPGPGGYEEIDTHLSDWTPGFETFCNHGNRVYAASGGGLTVVAGDPSCKTP